MEAKAKLLAKLKRFRKLRGVYIFDFYNDFKQVVAIIAGLDYASDGVALREIPDWLEERYSCRSPFGWPVIIENVFQSINSANETTEEDKVEFLFNSVIDFLTESLDEHGSDGPCGRQ